jgi:hypothetical protein
MFKGNNVKLWYVPFHIQEEKLDHKCGDWPCSRLITFVCRKNVCWSIVNVSRYTFYYLTCKNFVQGSGHLFLYRSFGLGQLDDTAPTFTLKAYATNTARLLDRQLLETILFPTHSVSERMYRRFCLCHSLSHRQRRLHVNNENKLYFSFDQSKMASNNPIQHSNVQVLWKM